MRAQFAFSHVVVWRVNRQRAQRFDASYAAAALTAERLAWHLQMWGASEYDGAYYSAAEKSRARTRYASTALVLVVIALFAMSRILR